MIVAVFLVSMFASLYTDRLWYSSVGYTHVFDTMLWTRVGLFVGFGLLMGGAVAGNMVIAYRARPFQRPDSPEQTGLDRYRDAVAPIRTLLLVSVAGVIGLFGGVAANGQWRTFLLWANRVPFHTSDAYFHKDVGFYVFTLPVAALPGRLRDRGAGALGAQRASSCTTCTAASASRPPATGCRRPRRSSCRCWSGLALLAKAVGYWLDRYDLVTGSGKLVTGMGYTDQHAVLPARNILVGVALICAVLFFLTVWRRTWLLPGVGHLAAAGHLDPARPDLAGVRPALPGRPDRAGQGGDVHRRRTSRRRARPTTSTTSRRSPLPRRSRRRRCRS